MTEEYSSIGLTNVQKLWREEQVTRSKTVPNQFGTQGCFAYNFIDMYQDFNPLQYRDK